MKRLIIRGLLLAVMVLGTTYLLSKRMQTTGYDPYQPYKAHFSALYNSSKNVRALSVGNSHAQAIDFNTLGIEGYHLWLSGADLFEVDYLLRDAVPQLPNVELVFINISYFSFQYDNGASNNRRIRRKWLYASTGRWDYINGDRDEFITGKLNSWLGVDTVLSTGTERLIKSVLGKERPTSVLDRKPDGQRLYEPYIECQHIDSYDALLAHSNTASERHLRLSRDMQSKHINLQKDTTEAFAGLLHYLNANEIQVLLYTPPYFTGYTQSYEQPSIDNMRRATQEIASNHQIEYLDYSTHPEFIHNFKLFFNSDHLNLCGARKFSRMLASKL